MRVVWKHLFLNIKLSTHLRLKRFIFLHPATASFNLHRRWTFSFPSPPLPPPPLHSALSAASIFLKVSSHNSSVSSLWPIVLWHKRLFVRCATVTRGPGCQRQQRGGGSLCLATGVWSKGKGRRSDTGPPLRESPLSTALYIAGRVPVFPIATCWAAATVIIQCTEISGDEIKMTVCAAVPPIILSRSCPTVSALQQ